MLENIKKELINKKIIAFIIALPDYMQCAAVFGAIACLVIGAAAKMESLPQTVKFILGVTGAVGILAAALRSSFLYFKYQKQLDRIDALAQEGKLSYHPIKAFQELRNISAPNKIYTRKQYRHYIDMQITFRLYLGDLKGLQDYAEMLKGDSAIYNEIQMFLAMERNGTADDIMKYASEAAAKVTAGVSPDVRVSIMMNKGVAYIYQRDYANGIDCMKRALKEYKDVHVRKPLLLHQIYVNIINAALQLDNSPTKREAIEALMEEYKASIDMSDALACTRFHDLQMHLYCQLGCEPVQMARDIYDVADNVLGNPAFPKQNQALFTTYIAHMICRNKLDYTKCIELILRYRDEYEKLPMPARYRAFRELSIFFTSLHMDHAVDYQDFIDSVFHYMESCACRELENYMSTLPEEAVYERIFCLQESAKTFSRGDKRIIDNLKSVINLQKNNQQTSMVIDSQLDLLDQYFFSDNVMIGFREGMQELIAVIYDEVKAQIAIVDFLPEKYSERCLRMSAYSYMMGKYPESVYYYREFQNAGFSIEHFSDGAKSYYFLCGIVTRVITFADTIRAIAVSDRLLTYESEVRDWFQRFPDHDGFIDSILLSHFIGQFQPVELYQAVWKNDAGLKEHFWMPITPLEIEADITYSAYDLDEKSGYIFFAPGKHPMQTGESLTLQIDRRKTKVNPIVNKVSVIIADRDPAEIKLMNTLMQIIDEHIPDYCPGLEELVRQYQKYILPVRPQKIE